MSNDKQDDDEQVEAEVFAYLAFTNTGLVRPIHDTAAIDEVRQRWASLVGKKGVALIRFPAEGSIGEIPTVVLRADLLVAIEERIESEDDESEDDEDERDPYELAEELRKRNSDQGLTPAWPGPGEAPHIPPSWQK